MQIRAAHTWVWDAEAERDMDRGPGPWVGVRIESQDRGRVLQAHYMAHALAFTLRVSPDHEIRWPEQCP